MSGYIGNDGSALAGGLNPSGAVQGFKLDALGNLVVNTAALAAALAGKLFAYSPGATIATTVQTTSGYPFSVFNPANSTKSILLASISSCGNGSGTIYHLNRTVADPAYTNAGNISSQQGGSSPPTSVASVTYASAASAWPSPYEQWMQTAQNTPTELLSPGGIYLPPGSGVTIWLIPNGTVTEFIRALGIEF